MEYRRNITVEIKAFVVFVSICCFSSNALATDYYVSPTGSASWSACININSPCSLQTAESNAVAGDIVNIRSGTYVLPFEDGGSTYWALAFHPANSGAPGNPITFQAYNGETVFFDASSSAGQENSVSSYGAYHRDYIVYDGIDTEAHQDSTGKAKGVMIRGSANCSVKNADITGSGGSGNNSGLRIENASYTTVQNLTVHGFAGTDTNCSGMMLYSSDHLLVENSNFYNNAVGIYDKDGSTNNTYRYNYFYSNTMLGYLLQKESGGPSIHDLSLYQNIFRSNQGAIELSGSTTKDTVDIYNNSFYSSGVGINMWGSGSVTNLHVYNNIFHSSGTATDYSNAGTGLYSDYNQFYNTTAGDDIGSNTLTTNPNFVSAGGADAEDYKRTSFPTDGRGGSYPSVRGVYITGNEVIGYSVAGASTPPPADDIGAPQSFLMEPTQ